MFDPDDLCALVGWLRALLVHQAPATVYTVMWRLTW